MSSFLYLQFPYLSSSTSFFISVVVCMFSEWVLKSFALIFTVLIAQRLLNDHELDFFGLYSAFKLKVLPILCIVFLYTVPQIYLVLRLKGVEDMMFFKGDLEFFIAALYFFVSVILLLFSPFILLTTNYTIAQSILASVRFVKRHRSAVLFYFLILFVSSFVFIMSDTLLHIVPVLHFPLRIVFMSGFATLKILVLLFIYKDCCDEGSFSIMI